MSLVHNNLQWPKILKISLCGASVATLVYIFWNQQREKTNVWQSFQMFLLRKKDETKESVKRTVEEVEKSIDSWIEELKDKYLSEETQEVIENIRELIEYVNKSDMAGKPYKSSVFILLSILERVHRISEFTQWESQLPNVSNVSDLKSVRHFSEIAFNIYTATKCGETDKKAIAEVMSIGSEDDIIFVEFTDDEGEEMCPKFILFVDHQSMSVVLSVRGTKSIKDALMDMVCDDSPFLHGAAHSGVLKATEKVMELVEKKLVEACRTHPSYKLVITGHSLGAGVAVLLTLQLLSSDANNSLIGNEIVCYAFAPPPVFREISSHDGAMATPGWVKDKIHIVINNHDCIPRTSLGTITRLLKSLRAIDELNLSLRQQIQLIRHERVDIDGEDEEEEVTKLMDQVITVVNNAPQHQFPYLQHPGHVIYFKKETETKDTKYVAIHEDSLAHPDRLYLLRNMLVDHKRTGYKLALDNLC